MTKIEKEKEMVSKIVAVYCNEKHKTARGEYCAECREVLNYSLSRLSGCKFGETKTSCKRCPIHCYKPDMRAKIKKIMRYGGPRMIFRYPMTVLSHWF